MHVPIVLGAYHTNARDKSGSARLSRCRWGHRLLSLLLSSSGQAIKPHSTSKEGCTAVSRAIKRQAASGTHAHTHTHTHTRTRTSTLTITTATLPPAHTSTPLPRPPPHHPHSSPNHHRPPTTRHHHHLVTHSLHPLHTPPIRTC
jgi:hypothetical protein